MRDLVARFRELERTQGAQAEVSFLLLFPLLLVAVRSKAPHIERPRLSQLVRPAPCAGLLSARVSFFGSATSEAVRLHARAA